MYFSYTAVHDDGTTSEHAPKDMIVPALGKFWKSICQIRLRLTKPNDVFSCNKIMTSRNNVNTNERTIEIIKSNRQQTGIECKVVLSDSGVL